MCHIPNLHKDLQVLSAIANNSNIEIFSKDGCCAIINGMWEGEMLTARFRMSLATVELFNFMVINLLIDDEVDTMGRGWTPGSKQVVQLVSAIIWSLAVFFEVMQGVGYFFNGMMRQYLGKFRHFFDTMVLIMTGSFIISLWYSEDVTADSFTTLLSVLLFLKWFRFLAYLRQFEVIGVHILPITSTMWNVGPFLLVLGVYVAASVNMYYALRNGYSLGECFLLIYRLAVLGDFDLTELEHKNQPVTRLDFQTGIISTSVTSIVNDSYRWYTVRIMLVVVSFVVGVSIMNLFVAILCSKYDEAASVAQRMYMRARAQIVLDQVAVRTGIRVIRKCSRKARLMEAGRASTSSKRSQRFLDVHTSESSARMTAQSFLDLDNQCFRNPFLWYVKQAPVDE